MITFNGVTKTVREWEEQLGLTAHGSIKYRMKRGWTFEEAITTPKIGKKETGYMGSRKRWKDRRLYKNLEIPESPPLPVGRLITDI